MEGEETEFLRSQQLLLFNMVLSTNEEKHQQDKPAVLQIWVVTHHWVTTLVFGALCSGAN